LQAPQPGMCEAGRKAAASRTHESQNISRSQATVGTDPAVIAVVHRLLRGRALKQQQRAPGCAVRCACSRAGCLSRLQVAGAHLPEGRCVSRAAAKSIRSGVAGAGHLVCQASLGRKLSMFTADWKAADQGGCNNRPAAADRPIRHRDCRAPPGLALAGQSGLAVRLRPCRACSPHEVHPPQGWLLFGR